MTEKIEFDLAVKSSSGLNKALEQASQQTSKLEGDLKSALAVLNKSSIGSSFNSAMKANALSVAEFRDGAAASFAIARKGSEEAAKGALGLGKELKTTQVAAVGFGDSMRSAFSAILLNPITITLAAIASLVSILKSAATESTSFRRAQLEIETILPKNTKLTSELVKQLEDLSKQYGTSATTQAKAYYEIISAGVSDAADGAKLLARANELATGGVAETGQTIDLLTTIYNVYGKELATTTEASDSLFKTVQIGKTTIAALSSDLGQALPIAKSFGIGLDEVGAILAQLTNSGISTSESVTLLNAVLSAIAKNGEKLGTGFNSTAVQTEGLGVVLERLKERTNGSNDALFELLGRQEAVRAVQSLTAKGLDNYNATLAEYANKAGVAGEASKKIIAGDLGKQFDILGSKISSASRSFIDVFTPAALAATKALNDFLTPGEIGTLEQQSRGYEQVRVKILSLEQAYKGGKISADAYQRSIGLLNTDLAEIANSADTAKNPLVLLSTGLEKEAANIKAQIVDLKSGFSILGEGPIEANIKVIELGSRLESVNKQLKELSTSSATGLDVVAPSTRSEDLIANEKKIQADLSALRLQFAEEEKTFNDQLLLAELDSATTRNEEITTQIFDQKVREANAAYEGELLKNALILDAQTEKATNDIAFQKREQDLVKAGNAKVLADAKAAKTGQIALEASFQNSRNILIGQGFALAGTLAKDGSKAQFLIQKAAALAEIAIGDGKARALIPAQTALIPFPANIAAAASLNAYVTAQTALGAAIVGASAIKGFADGGIVGASQGGDNRVATVRDGEMILNASQQKTLFDAINGGGFGGGNIQVIIDGREVAIAVRNQINQGFRLA